MSSWLLGAMEAIDAELPGRVIDINTAPADILERPDIGLCLASGVAVAMGSTPIGYIRGARLARLLAATMRDAGTDARAAREEAAKLRRDRRMLAASLGHELRTAVNAISGYSELIALGLDSGRTVAAARQNDIVWEAAQSLLATIDAVLDIARIDGGAARLEETEFALAPLAHGVARVLATIARERGVEIEIDVPADFPNLFADARMMRQILVNLASNGIKYGGDRVRIGARIDRRGQAVVEVRDNGKGMKASAIDEAIQPFRRKTSGGGAGAGLGLGLPLVKALAELHEGRFQLLSTAGRGTRAIVILPAGRVRRNAEGGQEAFAFQRPTSLFG